jgi:hypothetical protein
MNRELVDRVANAVLYEGYILYPYRPSVKNRQRWTFGGLYPEAYCRAQGGADAWSSRTECLVAGGPGTTVEAAVRFLRLTDRLVGEIVPPLAEWPGGGEPPFRPVAALQVGDNDYHTWQEAEECERSLVGTDLARLQERPHRLSASLPGRRWTEPLTGLGGKIAGVLVREQQPIEWAAELSAARLADGLYKVALTVENRTPPDASDPTDRDRALMRSLVSTHAILGTQRGEFVSLLDPPGEWREFAAGCRNVGTWPVLVGEEGERDAVLSSPIILYDYPRVAPESPGDLFDGTEIDEILTMRVLTLTDEEKRQASAVDQRVRAMLTRTETLGPGQLLGLHGTLRRVRPASEEGTDG